MLVTSLDREDIKAELRKRHGSIRAFAAARGIKPQAVADLFRGRAKHSRAATVVEQELQKAAREQAKSIKLDTSDIATDLHRLNAEAR